MTPISRFSSHHIASLLRFTLILIKCEQSSRTTNPNQQTKPCRQATTNCMPKLQCVEKKTYVRVAIYTLVYIDFVCELAHSDGEGSGGGGSSSSSRRVSILVVIRSLHSLFVLNLFACIVIIYISKIAFSLFTRSRSLLCCFSV